MLARRAGPSRSRSSNGPFRPPLRRDAGEARLSRSPLPAFHPLSRWWRDTPAEPAARIGCSSLRGGKWADSRLDGFRLETDLSSPLVTTKGSVEGPLHPQADWETATSGGPASTARAGLDRDRVGASANSDRGMRNRAPLPPQRPQREDRRQLGLHRFHRRSRRPGPQFARLLREPGVEALTECFGRIDRNPGQQRQLFSRGAILTPF